MSKCEDSDGKHGSIDLHSKIITTSNTPCEISQNNTSTQEVTITNHKRHKIYIDISVEADEGYVEYDDSGNSMVEKTGIKVPNKSAGSPGERMVTFDLKQDGTDSEELLEVSIKYYYDRDANEDDKNKTVNSIVPKVNLS